MLAVSGKRNKINFTASQGTTITTAPEDEPRRWMKVAGGVLIGLVTIVGVILGLMEVQGWHFG
jgi:choline-glycine betaine transporter